MDPEKPQRLERSTQQVMSIAREAVADTRNQRYAAMLRRALERKRDEEKKRDASR
jgi:hypothetical protein